MFLVRSAFWLGLGFVVMQPQIWGSRDDLGRLGEQALQSGKAALSAQVDSVKCDTIECTGGKAVLYATGILSNPKQAKPMQDTPRLAAAPVPRPRLDRAG